MILFVLRIFQRRIFQNISKHWAQNNLVCFEHISKKDISKLDLYLFYRIRLWLNWNVELILGENILKKWWRTECVFSWPTKVSAIGHVAPYIKGDILVITYFRKCFKNWIFFLAKIFLHFQSWLNNAKVCKWSSLHENISIFRYWAPTKFRFVD